MARGEGTQSQPLPGCAATDRVGAARLAARHHAPPPLLLDVRTPEEFSDEHLEGAVRVDPVGDALRRLRQRPAVVSAVLYCSVGQRSSALADALLARGVGSIQNLEGSLFEWANEGQPVVASDGRTGKVHPYDREWGVLLRRELWSRAP